MLSAWPWLPAIALPVAPQDTAPPLPLSSSSSSPPPPPQPCSSSSTVPPVAALRNLLRVIVMCMLLNASPTWRASGGRCAARVEELQARTTNRLVDHAGALLSEEGLGGVVERAGTPSWRGVGGAVHSRARALEVQRGCRAALLVRSAARRAAQRRDRAAGADRAVAVGALPATVLEQDAHRVGPRCIGHRQQQRDHAAHMRGGQRRARAEVVVAARHQRQDVASGRSEHAAALRPAG